MIKKVFSKILSVIIFLIFVFSLISMAMSIISKKNKVPVVFGYGIFTVISDSMAPTLKTEEVIITRKVQADTLKEGDIITFYSSDPSIYGRPNTHRIVSVDKADDGGYLFHTKGDNNEKADSYPVHEKDIIGKLAYKPAVLSKILKVLNNKAVFLFGLIFPILIAIFFEMKNISDSVKSGRKHGKKSDISKGDN